MKTSDRRELILKLVSENVVLTQDELLELLLAKGVETTQATVSRDINKLNLIKKMDSNGNNRYCTSAASSSNFSKAKSFILSSVTSVDYALNNVVIKCNNGMAQAACAAIDTIEHNLIVGTIAGDDTILIITRSTEASKELFDYFNNLLGL